MSNYTGSYPKSRTKTKYFFSSIVLIFIISIVLPRETSFQFGTIRLFPHRVLLLFLISPCFYILLSGRCGRIRAPDILFAAHCLFASVALFIWAGFDGVLEPAGNYILECYGGYLVGRCFVRSPQDYKNFVKFTFFLVLLFLPFVIYEVLSGYHVIREVSRSLLGSDEMFRHAQTQRLGLYRGFGPFDHPIHYGIFCASVFGGAYFVLGKGRFSLQAFGRIATIVCSTFVSLSTGPYLALAVQVFVVCWEGITRRLAKRWFVLAAGFAAFYGLIDILSNRTPVKVLASYVSLNSQSANNRILIWDYGTAEVERNPFFGIGLADWTKAHWMVDSLDNFWLWIAVRFGLPALLLMILAIGFIVYTLSTREFRSEELGHSRAAWLTTLSGFVVAGATVHYWGAMFVFFMFFLGAGVWLIEPEAASGRRRLRRKLRTKTKGAVGERGKTQPALPKTLTTHTSRPPASPCRRPSANRPPDPTSPEM